MKKVYSLNLTAKQEKELFSLFSDDKVSPPQYAKWQLKVENCTITCYESGKTVFQGKDAFIYASKYIDNNQQYPQAGSDEVGTGDYFGPVCVCASIVSKEDENFLNELGIKDSKQLSDERIIEIAPKLIKRLKHSLLILDNATYNKVHQNNNLNEIKAKLHNQAYVNLNKKYKLPKLIVIDQFTPENYYYRYLKDEKTIISSITFQTKAENDYLSVASSAIIARYALIEKFKEMEKQYEMEFAKGSGSLVDECASKFVKKYGTEELKNVAKLHFKNTNRI